MSKITRRETLARGGQAVAAAAVLTTLPSIAHAKEDAEILRAEAEVMRKTAERVSAMETRIGQLPVPGHRPVARQGRVQGG